MTEQTLHWPERAHPRWPTHVDVRYGNEEQISAGEGLDISEGGLGFRGKAIYPTGSEIQLAFRIENPLSSWIRVKAVVRYARNDRIGVEFISLSPGIRERIVRDIFQDQVLRGHQA